MADERKIIEGTWEEIVRRAPEFAGHRLRITVLEDLATPSGSTTPILDELIDHEFVAYCEREADDSVTLEEVRAATSKIKDSMARVIIDDERADRF